jgi:prepilin-type N-terminal cleavage/methylation domain-containing protein
MNRRRRARAYTLIEVMIVVALVGILALLASQGYQRWMRTAFLTEAQDMVANIRAAEESFMAENGGYLSVSAGLGPGYDYPAPTPGAFKTAWGGACSACVAGVSWTSLNVSPNAPLAFGYSLLASTNASPSVPAAVTSVTVNGQSLNTSALTAPWYFIEADGDMNGDGVFTKVYGDSATNQVFISDEGE